MSEKPITIFVCKRAADTPERKWPKFKCIRCGKKFVTEHAKVELEVHKKSCGKVEVAPTPDDAKAFLAREPIPRWKVEGDCCANEKRNWDGGCDNCGDPCL